MKCKYCIKWLHPHQHANGTFGKCIKNNFWCNENYYYTSSKVKKKEGKV